MEVSAAMLAGVFTASLAGSLHCAGMCGGFVAFYSGSAPGRPGNRLVPHLAYSLGRLTTYAVLGGVFGALGAAVDRAGGLAGVHRPAAIAAGLLMVLWGVYALLQALDVRLPRVAMPRAVMQFSARLMGSLRGRPPVARASLLGLLSTLLPCGWLYAFATLAAGTGHPLGGVLVMVSFWAGTLPLMLGFGVVLNALSAPLRRRLPAVTAVLLIVIGMLWLAGRVNAPAHGGHQGHAPGSGMQIVIDPGAGSHASH